LYYEYHRWYDPSTGRFISQDPQPGKPSIPQSVNLYTYSSNEPTVLTDPTGEADCDIRNPFAYGGCTLQNVYSFGRNVAGKAYDYGRKTLTWSANEGKRVLIDEGKKLIKSGIDTIKTIADTAKALWDLDVRTNGEFWGGVRDYFAWEIQFYNSNLHSKDRNIRTLYECTMTASIITLATVGVIYAAPAASFLYYWIVSQATLTIPTWASGAALGGLIFGPEYSEQLAHLASATIDFAWNVGSGCASDAASYF